MLPGAVGLMQATEVIKLVLGEGLPMIGRLLLYDAMKMSIREVKVRRNPDCELCGEHPSCLLYTSPSPRDRQKSRMPSSA